MKKTYVTNMPNHIGAFLQASKCFAKLDINICRVSYNKAVDSHTLFIDVEGDKDKLLMADKELEKIGYLQDNDKKSNIILMEFQLINRPGSVTEILEIIEQFSFNISYMSFQEEDREYQLFKMGLFVDDEAKVKSFIEKAREKCNVNVIEYNPSEKVFDNSIFYTSFVTSLIEAGGISESAKNELLINTNLAMQMLDEQGLSPYKTFDSISKFADLLARCRGEAFSPRITRHKITDDTEIILIEPPCGSNTAIIKSMGQYLFVDTGYAYYKEEMIQLFKSIIPDFDNVGKTAVVTHADVDHCGLLNIFDKVIVSEKSAKSLKAESEGKDGYREKNPLHKPYIRICKTLTGYTPVNPDKLEVPWKSKAPYKGVLWQIGFLDFGELHFEVYECRGGHLPGEIVLIDYNHRITFTGDVYVNLKGMTSEQKQYNQYAPILMTSVDTDPELCKAQRECVMQRLGFGKWQIFGAHGMKKDYEISLEL